MNEKNSYWYQLKDDFIDFYGKKAIANHPLHITGGRLTFLSVMPMHWVIQNTPLKSVRLF